LILDDAILLLGAFGPWQFVEACGKIKIIIPQASTSSLKYCLHLL